MGHNWLAVLYNKNIDYTAGFTADGKGQGQTGGPGGCARCHFTGAWKEPLGTLDINKDGDKSPGQDGYFTGTGSASFAKLATQAGWGAWNVDANADGVPDTLDTGFSGATVQKQANTIECLMCHAANYKPARNGKPVATYGTADDPRTVFNAGARKPGYTIGSFGGDATIFANQFSSVTQAIYEYDDSSWASSFIGTSNVFIQPDYSNDALVSISKTPSNEACSRCHDYAGGGDRNKRGMWFRPGYDVHANLSCLDCHKTEKDLNMGTSTHKMALGVSSDIWARDIKLGADYHTREEHSSECSNSGCHGTRPHSSKLLNDHYSGGNDLLIGDGQPAGKVDCRTCHIPYQYGQEIKDFTQKTAVNPVTGLFDVKTVNRTTTTSGQMADYTVNKLERPVYKWYNTEHIGHGPAAATRDEALSKITTFTRYEITSIVDGPDAGTAKPIPLKMGVFFQTGDIYLAATTDKGVPATTSLEANMSYTAYTGTLGSGTPGVVYSKLGMNNFLIGHRVQPKAAALKCSDCHSSNSILDFEALGYDADETATLEQAK